MTPVIHSPVNTPDAWTERARTCEESWTACGWSYEGQVDRMEAVVEALDPKAGESLLDWGCGTGDLADYLSFTVDYAGYDWSEGMIERAIRSHPERRFCPYEPTGVFDLVACVGPFNLPGNKQHTWHTLRHLWDTKQPRALAASMYAGDDPSCLRYGKQELMAMGHQLAHDATVTRIRGNDLLLLVRR